MALGVYPEVTLAQAREAHQAARKVLAARSIPWRAASNRSAKPRPLFMAMTFVRTSELIGVRWKEFDLDNPRWDIPAERMKMKSLHIVLLSRQAVQLLRNLQTLTGHRALLFPGDRNHEKPMSNNTILKALERVGYKGRMTGHGFRGIASTVLHEHGWPHEHIEPQLARQERDDTSAAYNHALYLKPRAEMMQWWSDYVEQSITGASVIDLRRG